MNTSPSNVKLIAFYLPQFHQIPENDEWWGKGYTEWTAVTAAEPNWPGHAQPQLPADLGFYDLRLREVLEEQVHLARRGGIYGFCFHYYWFADRRLLEKPLFSYVSEADPDFPFCICWANENWTRRWDGSENELLIEQTHSLENARDFADDTFWLFEEPRYIRVDGRPLLVVYRAGILSDISETLGIWRDMAAAAGLPGLYIVAAETFDYKTGIEDGFDATLEFPPHGYGTRNFSKFIYDVHDDFDGHIHSYAMAASKFDKRHSIGDKVYRGVMPSWDNTPRRKRHSSAFYGATLDLYKCWLRMAIDFARENTATEDRIVFVNAWNEWGEGAVLEPDGINGSDLLRATADVLGQVNPNETIVARPDGSVDAAASIASILSGMTYPDDFVGNLDKSIRHLEQTFLGFGPPKSRRDEVQQNFNRVVDRFWRVMPGSSRRR